MLILDRISKSFNGFSAVKDVSFTIKEQQVFGLIGPNGAGKTTIFNLITGVLPLTSGNIIYKGESINGLLPHHIAKLGISRTFQNIRLFKNMSVLENLRVAQNMRIKHPFGNINPWESQEERLFKEEALDILRWIGLYEQMNQKASTLPYGSQRCLEIARALATRPDFLALDEPTAGMTDAESQEIIDLIKKLQDMGKTILLIEHDMNVVMGCCDWIVVLNFGKKIAEGNRIEIQNDPSVIEAYLGRDEDNDYT